jgi:hypothetical protein
VASPRSSRWSIVTKSSSVPGRYARPIGARIPLAHTWRSLPSELNDTIEAEYGEVGVQESHGAEMPSRSRPSVACTRPLLSPTPAGSVRTVSWVANVSVVASKPV